MPAVSIINSGDFPNSELHPLYVSGVGGSVGAGDASAANQSTQINLETEIRNRLVPSGVLTPGFISAYGSGTVAAGARQVSFANAGLSGALVLNSELPAGASVDFSSVGNTTLGAITYNASGNRLLIQEVR